MRVSADVDLLATYGASRVLVKIGKGVTLAPTPREKYKRPHEAVEVARAAGPWRLIGNRIVDNGGIQRDTADLVSNLLNALPDTGKVTAVARTTLWQHAVSAEDVRRTNRMAVSNAKRGYADCLSSVAKYENISLRGCLGRLHDMQIWTLNRKYWRSVSGSS